MTGVPAASISLLPGDRVRFHYDDAPTAPLPAVAKGFDERMREEKHAQFFADLKFYRKTIAATIKDIHERESHRPGQRIYEIIKQIGGEVFAALTMHKRKIEMLTGQIVAAEKRCDALERRLAALEAKR